MRPLQAVCLLSWLARSTLARHHLQSADFDITIDDATGAILSIAHPDDNATMNWISGPDNTPWQPAGSHWGLGYTGIGGLHRWYWTGPSIDSGDERVTAIYQTDSLTVDVKRQLNESSRSFEECYTFTNTGDSALDLASKGPESLAISTPFNDHYTNTSDVLKHRCHAHIWASGGSSSWVKLTRMGLRGPHLGLVMTKGALNGYSVVSRDEVTLSNTRGFFLVHPSLPTLQSQESSELCWTMFWHDDWDDFFQQAMTRSSQFVHVEAESLTVPVGDSLNLNITYAGDGSVSLEGAELQSHGDGHFSTKVTPDTVGENVFTVAVDDGSAKLNTTIVTNIVPEIEGLIANRTRFIVANQQLGMNEDSSIAGAYAVYDNEMDGIAKFEIPLRSDTNTGRERVGMGVLIARWLQRQRHSHPQICASLRRYYSYVINELQDESGYVYSTPPSLKPSSERLYNWPWVMQLHLNVAKLGHGPATSHGNYTATPKERFMDTLESYYSEGGKDFYAIGIPIYEGLGWLNQSEDHEAYQRALRLFTEHGEQIAAVGENYPAAEVNYEQSIVAPAAMILLELYRATQNQTWLDAAQPHFDRLLAFGGRQPDYHLHDVAIRHWDGYWFGKKRMWGDTFPHYWSTLTGIAMHHYAKATGDTSYSHRAEEIFRSNLALFDGDGRAYCAFIYPVTVNGRPGYENDPYANDQDWALANWLQVRADE